MMDIAALAWPLGRTDVDGFSDISAMVSQNFPMVTAGVSMSLLIGVMDLAARGFPFNDCTPGVEPDPPAPVIILRNFVI